jgi:hypothetical protein
MVVDDERFDLAAGATVIAPRDGRHDLKSVAERIGGVEADKASQLGVFNRWSAGSCEGRAQGVEIAHDESRMGLGRRPERGLDPEVQLGVVIDLEPAATASPQMLGLVDFFQAEHSGIEGTSRAFATGRHRELDVMDPENRHSERLLIRDQDRDLGPK